VPPDPLVLHLPKGRADISHSPSLTHRPCVLAAIAALSFTTACSDSDGGRAELRVHH